MSQESVPATSGQQPAGNQFSLRGLFVLITAMSVIFALLALAIRQPYQWLGALGVLAFCLLLVGAIEWFRVLFPPRPRHIYYFPPPASPDALDTTYFGDGDSPFAPRGNPGESPFAPESGRTTGNS